ncbi:MAG: hypothetical protein WC455_15230 [Dehalococcoidia bacterium]|jgi:hypothetical protein
MGAAPDEDEDGKEFVESVQFIPENFEAQLDSLPEEFAPEIPEETRKKEEAKGSEVTGTEETEPEAQKPEEGQGETDDQPQVTPEKLAAENEELRKRLEKSEARSGYWQRKAEKQAAEAKQPMEQPAPNRPKPEDFKSDEEYLEALTDYKVEAKLREQDTKRAEAAKAQDVQGLQSWTSAMMAEGVSQFSDFEEIVTDPIVPLTQGILQAVRGAKDIPHAEIIYYLGKNIRETAKISRLGPEAMNREIGAIADRIAADKAKAEEPQPEPRPQKRISNAPPPINPVRGASTGVMKDPEKMSHEEFRKWRRKGS